MIICGMISDKLVGDTRRRMLLSAFYCIGCATSITAAFALGPGPNQLMLLGVGMFLAAASAGPSGAAVAALTPAALHGTSFAILTLANNALGLAPGPIVTGWVADRIGLLGAFRLLAFASIAASLIFVIGRRSSRTATGLVKPA
jgi:MFS family permease